MRIYVSFQKWVTFKDTTIDFTQEEWGQLDSPQKALYWEVMLGNYQNLLALGKRAPPNPDVCCQLSFHVREEPFGISAGTSGARVRHARSTQKQHPGLEL